VGVLGGLGFGWGIGGGGCYLEWGILGWIGVVFRGGVKVETESLRDAVEGIPLGEASPTLGYWVAKERGAWGRLYAGQKTASN
jgi:hypothetical protein